ncbi:MAG: hypothetical protein FWF59_03155 [Turicibacter sp.]|nr:hypothetical protein [Turicibacter sp.]
MKVDFRGVHVNGYGLNHWWQGSAIPASRQQIKKALEKLNLADTHALLNKSYGLSLSDHYWIKPLGSELTLESVNFFQNTFSKDMGELVFEGKKSSKNFDFLSPDNTSDGWLKKKWVIRNGKRFLAKGGSLPYVQEPFNEEIASRLYNRLGISHVPYHVVVENKEIYSMCENFLDEKTEYVSAYRVMQSYAKDNSESRLEHLLRACRLLGIPNPKVGTEHMFVTDFILTNTDRHFGNFGFIRNVDTLECLGMAPLFDSGTSLWSHRQDIGSLVPAKPFKKSHLKQLGLVSDFSWLDTSKLQGFNDEVYEVLNKSPLLTPGRKQQIVEAIDSRIQQVVDFGKKMN